jgi:hypothetical protein
MANEMVRKEKRTNIYVMDEELWAWAQYRAKILDCDTVSDYLFDLIKQDKIATEKKEGHGKNKKAAPAS